MRHLLICIALTASLTACNVGNRLATPTTAGAVGAAIDAAGQEMPFSLATTLADERAVVDALESADGIQMIVNYLIDEGELIPGTPRAKKVQAAMIALRGFIASASAAQRATNTKRYQVAMSEVAKAFMEISVTLQAISGEKK